MLEDYFVAGTGEGRFLALEASDPGDPTRGKCGEALVALPSGGALAIALPLEARGRLGRLGALLTLPHRIARAEKILSQCGATSVQRYGVTPDLRTPAVIFPLGTPAARYAEEHLVPGPRKWVLAVVRKVLTYCLGYDPSVGAVLVVGRKP
jgi:hypothetical protein